MLDARTVPTQRAPVVFHSNVAYALLGGILGAMYQSIVLAAIGIAVSLLLVILVAGALLINAYIQKERQRDLDDWSIRLGLIAETRVEAVEEWLYRQQRSLQELAGNASLQLYLWQVSQRISMDTGATISVRSSAVLAAPLCASTRPWLN